MKMKSPTIAEKIWKMAWPKCEGDVPVMKALRSILSWRTTPWWKERKRLGHLLKETRGVLNGEPEDLHPVFFEKGEGIQLETRGDGKTVVDWINGKATQM